METLFLQRKTTLIVDCTLSFEIQCCVNTWDMSSRITEKTEASMVCSLISGYKRFFFQHFLNQKKAMSKLHK